MWETGAAEIAKDMFADILGVGDAASASARDQGAWRDRRLEGIAAPLGYPHLVENEEQRRGADP